MKLHPEFNVAAILSKISASDVSSDKVQQNSTGSHPFETFFEAALQHIDDPQLAATIATLNQSGKIMPDLSEAFVVPPEAIVPNEINSARVTTPAFRTLQLLNGRSVITSQLVFSEPVIQPHEIVNAAVEATLNPAQTTDKTALVSMQSTLVPRASSVDIESPAQTLDGEQAQDDKHHRGQAMLVNQFKRPLEPSKNLEDTVLRSAVRAAHVVEIPESARITQWQEELAGPVTTEKLPLDPVVQRVDAKQIPVIQEELSNPDSTEILPKVPAMAAEQLEQATAEQFAQPARQTYSTNTPPLIAARRSYKLEPELLDQYAPGLRLQPNEAYLRLTKSVDTRLDSPSKIASKPASRSKISPAAGIPAAEVSSRQPPLWSRIKTPTADLKPIFVGEMPESSERYPYTETWLATLGRSNKIPVTNQLAQLSMANTTAIESRPPPISLYTESSAENSLATNPPMSVNLQPQPFQVHSNHNRSVERWMHIEEFGEQFGSIIKGALMDRSIPGQTSLRIILFPENMGSIEAEIIDNNRSVTVNLVAQNDDVLRMLRDNSQILRDALNQGASVELNILKDRGASDGQASRDSSRPGNNDDNLRDNQIIATSGDEVLTVQDASDTGALDTYV